VIYMDKSAVLKIIENFRNVLELKGVKAEKIILFGSYATGQYREDSDIDLVVISRDFNNKTYWQRIDLLSEAIYDIFEPIEATAFTPDEWNSKESIITDFAQNGEVVYG
jgi:predicted nucleotidyltransferase